MLILKNDIDIGLNKKKFIDFFCITSLLTSIIVAIYCMFNYKKKIQIDYENFKVFAVESVLINSTKTIFENLNNLKNTNKNLDDIENFEFWNFKDKLNITEKKSDTVEYAESDLQKSSVDNFTTDSEIGGLDDERHSPNEKTYKVIETHFSSSGTTYENISVKNTTAFNLNIAEELAKRPEVYIKETSEPQVLIFHTHTSEGYMTHDRDFCYESFYPRSRNNSQNVTRVGDAIVQSLKENGINSIHCTFHHDDPTYNGSYVRAANTVKNIIEKYPSIQVVIDVHRDSIGNPTTGKVKPIFVFNGKKAAQLMIISGCDLDGKNNFPNWEKNLRLALRTQKSCETIFPGMTRAMKFAEVKYNMNLTPGSMLVEIGSDVNTLSEAILTGKMFGIALSKVLNSLKT